MIEKFDFYYPPADSNRKLHIYLPNDYYESSERYPVMYFFDGHNLFRDSDATYGKCWGLEAFLDRWAKKMIIVGMECSHEGNTRLDEYSPYSFHYGTWGDVHGIGRETMDWIVDDIKPMIDSRYRTWPHREATGIAGSSMGGLMSIYAAGSYNATFSKAACLSSAVRMCVKELKHDIAFHNIHPDTRVYLSWGTEESGGTRATHEEDLLTPTARANRALETVFHQKGAITKLYCQTGGHHCEADWEKQVRTFMEFLWY